MSKERKKNDKKEEISCKIQALSKSNDTTWVVQPSMSKSVEQGYGIMIMIINYILKAMTVIHPSSNQTYKYITAHSITKKVSFFQFGVALSNPHFQNLNYPTLQYKHKIHDC